MSGLVCPYCRSEVDLRELQAITCEGCSTPHHADCYSENGGCTIFGCSKAPAEEPALQVLLPELSQVSAADLRTTAPRTAPPTQNADSTPPPPRIGGGPAAVASSTIHVYVPLDYQVPAKKRVTFVLLGIVLGCFGVHNFYAGFVRKGVFQLCLTFFSCFYLAIVSWLWAVVEICMVNTDAEGVAFT